MEISYNHIEQIRVIFAMISYAGLKVNSTKCRFGFNYIPFLGYLITQEGIQPDPDKVQGIMDLV